LPAGEYVINVHYYSKEGNDEEITVKATRTAPYQRVIERTVTLSPRQETTIISFYIDTEGTIDDLRTDLQIPLRIILQ
jgi:hypothetical protein